MSRPRVHLRACPDYDPERIRRIVADALDAFDLHPAGRTLVKPNVVASGEYFPHAHTRAEFLEGVLRALRDRGGAAIEELAVGERCGITIPTRFAFEGAGLYEMADRVGGVELYHFEEVPQVEVPLYHQGRLRDAFFTPEPVARADFFVNCPKFKAHPWTTVTFGMKNYIGIQDDRHRLIDHDHKLDEKVADLQYIAQPQLVAIDAIIAGEGRMLTPLPFDLGLVILGDNQLAVDAVCCQIIGVDPMSVAHLRLAFQRGFGPVDLDQIELGGDVTLAQARERATGFRVGLIRVEDYFRGTAIRAYGGPPPSDSTDYCWGGCPGALEEAIEILRLYDKSTDTSLPPVHIMFGAHDGPIDANDGEKVVFLGDCAAWHGKLGGKDVAVKSTYVDRSKKNPHQASADDIFAKMIAMEKLLWSSRSEQVLRVPGCPVSVAEQVLLLVKMGHLRNPYLDPKQAPGFLSAYLSWRTRTTMQRLLGQPYQRPGATPRGKARPKQNLPPSGAPTPLETSAGPEAK